MDKFDVMAVNKIQAEEIARLRELVEQQKNTIEALCEGTDGSTPAIVQLGRQDVRIAELEARQIPEGCVAVPRRPTKEMLDAWFMTKRREVNDDRRFYGAYTAMLAAAPEFI